MALLVEYTHDWDMRKTSILDDWNCKTRSLCKDVQKNKNNFPIKNFLLKDQTSRVVQEEWQSGLKQI